MRFPFKPFLLLGLAAVVLAGAAVVVYQALESERAAEGVRQERFMRNAAFAVVDELGSELFTMYSAFSYDLMARRDSGSPVTETVLAEAVGRYRTQARFPELFEGLAAVEWTGTAWEYITWTERGWLRRQRPDWADSLTPPLGRELGFLNRPSAPSFSLEKPVLILPLRSGRSAGEISAVALRFSKAVVLEQVVPTLVRQQFSESNAAQPYRADVRNRDLIVERTPADWEVPLLPTTSFDTWFDYYVNRLKTMDRSRLTFERALPASGSAEWNQGWGLAVRRLPDGLETEMVWAQIRNAALAAGFFLVLFLGFAGLFQVVRRASVRAGEERTFLALVSHELKTPIAVVRAMAENLSRGVASPDRAREYGEVLLTESTRLGRMVGNVLALTAVRGGLPVRDRDAVDLGELVRERAAREDVPEGAQLTVLVHPGLPLVWGHAATLAAAVDNLVSNAFHHGLKEGGRVRLLVEPHRRWRRRGVQLLVEDDGPGFSWSEGQRIVHPFRRGRRATEEQRPGGGVGLGLVRSAARAFGGSLEWGSRPGVRTWFSLWLPEAP